MSDKPAALAYNAAVSDVCVACRYTSALLYVIRISEILDVRRLQIVLVCSLHCSLRTIRYRENCLATLNCQSIQSALRSTAILHVYSNANSVIKRSKEV